MRLPVAASLALLVLYPVAWTAPLMRAGLLPLFGLSEISVLSGLASLAGTDPVLAALVALFALAAPYAKTLALLAVQLGRAGPRTLALAEWAGRLAMADIFLISLYIAMAKGIGVGRVETAWGLYLFSGCILASLALSWATRRALKAAPRR
jgi:paraquat-inducible protein A